MNKKKEKNMGNSLGGLEDIFGKFMSEEVLKGIVQGLKEGVPEAKAAGLDNGWCHVNGDKPVTSWVVMQVHTGDNSDFSDSVNHWKKKIALFLKNLPEGQGLMFLPATFQIHTHSDHGGE